LTNPCFSVELSAWRIGNSWLVNGVFAMRGRKQMMAYIKQDQGQISLAGQWVLDHVPAIAAQISQFAPPGQAGEGQIVSLAGVETLDTAGALMMWQLLDKLPDTAKMGDVPPQWQDMIKAVGDAHTQMMPAQKVSNSFYQHLVDTGEAAVDVAKEAYAFTSFLGLVVVHLLRSLTQPWRLRVKAIIYHMDEVGVKAMPIVGLLGLLIGVVISYQGADQLRQFGADVFVVNLLGISILREIGVLMTAIIVAGRSGSSFTAQIGAMQVGQEIDAMRTMGLPPVEMLVLPRVIALTLTLPLLSFYASIMGLVGGALMCWMQLGIGPGAFLHQLQDAIGVWTVGVGLIKAPFFAFIIALVGCYQGFSVSGSAESVGKMTTRSVVHAIFLVILLDAVFSILFAWLKI
jgi:phospholipid/cholesterol/gamma-HCH transport system permease protein